MTLLTVETFYALGGVGLALVAGRIAWDRTHPQRWGSALFWGLLAVIFLFGKWLSPVADGYLVLAMVLLAATKRVGRGSEKTTTREERIATEERLRHRLLWPALLIPGTAVAGALLLGRAHLGGVWLAEPKQVTLIALSLGAVAALAVAVRVTGARPAEPLAEGSRLLQAMGWALILPQMLAALGGLFARAGVGTVVADLVARILPTQFPVVAVVAYCLGMALFTMALGNAFAAFAVITSGIGLPLIVQAHHGNPAIMAAVGMLAGYCGTLVTPMAANFNLVPVLLLDLRDPHAVIKAQVPVALAVFTFNVLLMWQCVYRF